MSDNPKVPVVAHADCGVLNWYDGKRFEGEDALLRWSSHLAAMTEKDAEIKRINFLLEQECAYGRDLDVQLSAAQAEIERLTQVLRNIAFCGMDSAPGTDREYFLQHQLGKCISEAAWAIKPAEMEKGSVALDD